MKIVVTGGRDKTDYKHVKLVHNVFDLMYIKEVFVGDCPTGIDKTVRDICEFNDTLNLNVFIANWDKHGKAAGPIRNREMLEAADKDAIVLAFPGGRGTENCVKQAKELGMVVLRVEV